MLIVEIFFDRNGYKENIITEVTDDIMSPIKDKIISCKKVAQQILREVRGEEHIDKVFFKDSYFRTVTIDTLASFITKVNIIDKK